LFLCHVFDDCSVAFSLSAGNRQGTTDGLVGMDDEKTRLGSLNAAGLNLTFTTDNA
jgi:hypothetical protein